MSGRIDSSTAGLYNCRCQSAGAQLIVAGKTYTADFTGNIAVLVDTNQLKRFLAGAKDVTTVSLLIQEHVMHGIGAGIGLIEVVMDPERVPPQSTLTAIRPGTPFPAIQDYNININVTIPNLLPGIIMRNKTSNPGPAILRNPKAMNFPPNNDVYQLVSPIELEDVNNPGPVLATIQTWPTTLSPPSS